MPARRGTWFVHAKDSGTRTELLNKLGAFNGVEVREIVVRCGKDEMPRSLLQCEQEFADRMLSDKYLRQHVLAFVSYGDGKYLDYCPFGPPPGASRAAAA